MYISSVLATPPQTSVDEIDEGDIGTTVRVSGTVTDASSSDGIKFFRIKGEQDSVQAVHFDGDLPVKEGQQYTFDGRVKLYEGELELVVNDISGVSAGTNPG
ncbi:MAG: hypothetical protein SVY41_00555 [Candidatus Nanohaloarchaea archaeon]|nr:hypothetical protein [Candidatus Nanohaloarchaea archaeon]